MKGEQSMLKIGIILGNICSGCNSEAIAKSMIKWPVYFIPYWCCPKCET